MQRRARPEFETLGNIVAEVTEMYRELRELRDFAQLVVTTWKQDKYAEFRAEVADALNPPDEEAEDEQPEPAPMPETGDELGERLFPEKEQDDDAPCINCEDDCVEQCSDEAEEQPEEH